MSFAQIRSGIVGLALVLSAGAAASAQVIALGSSNEAPRGFFGGAVASVPDIDGDGKPDLVVGAPNETVNGLSGAGRVYIVSGSTGKVLRVLNSPSPRINGSFGISVSGVPDVNGDNRGDIVVGASNEGESPIATGKAYVFSGATGAMLAQMNSPNRQTGGAFGTSVSWVPNAGGDGKPGVVVGAPNESNGNHPAGAGRAYVYNARTGQLISKLVPWSPKPQGSFGFAVAGLPDPGLGSGVVIVGAPREGIPDNAGRVHLHLARTGARICSNQSANNMENGFFGYSVASVPDANGDGYPDIVIGAPYEAPGASPRNVGRAYIYNGKDAKVYLKLLPTTPMVDMQFGISVAGTASVNGNGRGTAIVGSWQDSPAAGPVRCGRAHVFSGSDGKLVTTLVSPGRMAGGRFGVAVAGVPSTTGKPAGDIVIGASAESGGSGAAQAGRAYLIRN